MIELILGGARSGKSRLAEQRALNSGLPVTYIATATAGDGEMAARIQHHRERRPEHWHLIEEPLHLAARINHHEPEPACLLIDCLTLWVSNWLMENNATEFANARDQLIQALSDTPHRVILVSNETGMGVIPLGNLSRDFVDHSGWLHQRIGAMADNVIMTMAGLPLPLKQNGRACFDI